MLRTGYKDLGLGYKLPQRRKINAVRIWKGIRWGWIHQLDRPDPEDDSD